MAEMRGGPMTDNAYCQTLCNELREDVFNLRVLLVLSLLSNVAAFGYLMYQLFAEPICR